MRIVKDSIYVIDDKSLGIDLVIDEGKQYYFRDITWTGNTQYSSEMLNSVLRIEKGDIYDVVTMEERLFEAAKHSREMSPRCIKTRDICFSE